MKNKGLLRIVSCLLAIASMSAFSACDLSGILGSLQGGSSAKESVTDSSENSSENSENGSDSAEDSSGNTENSSGSSEDSSESSENSSDSAEDSSDSSEDSSGTTEDGLDFTPPKPATQYGYNSLKKEKNGAKMCQFYEDFYEASLEFHTSNRNLRIETDADGDYATLDELNYAQYGLTNEEAVAVWKVFGDENPIFYWMDVYCSYDGEVFYYFVDTTYASASERKKANEAIEKMALECDGYLRDGMSDVEIALTIYDYLLDKIDYAYESDGQTVVEESWAYNIAGGAMRGYGVCECYAETYAYLCGLYGIECLNVVGYAGEENDETNWGGHAWNYLCLDDKWYAVDATWGDYVESDGVYNLREYFGMELSTYNATHEADLPTDLSKEDSGISYQCALPTLEKGLSPVLVGKEGEEKIMVATVEEAFATMTDERGKYEIILYPETSLTEEKGVEIYTEGAYIFETVTLPKVAQITFQSSDPNYKATLATLGKVTPQCRIIMDGVTYEEADWVNAWRWVHEK